jgi:hypothetical protein
MVSHGRHHRAIPEVSYPTGRPPRFPDGLEERQQRRRTARGAAWRERGGDPIDCAGG